MSLRLSAAVWSNISDCDEVYNYWEPLHFLMYGSGFQTWEYSPDFALRSYGYVWLYNLPAQIYKLLVPSSRITTFFMIRCCIGAACAGVEAFFYQTLCQRLSRNIGRIYLLFSLLSTGLFISSCAFLPSSFSMVMNMLAVGLWLKGVNWAAVFCTAASTLVGWPFAAVLGLPVALDMLLIKREWQKFVIYSGLSGVVIGGLLLQVDSFYYGRTVFAPLQIVLYNVFSPHGPNLYGQEPLSYYLVNSLLNFNIVFPLALLSLPLICLSFYLTFGQKRKPIWSRLTPIALLEGSMLVWLVVFFRQPHKEERFLFPIYPLLCLSAAISLDSVQRMAKFGWIWLRKSAQPAVVLLMVSFAVISISRTFALYRNYHGVFDVFVHLNEKSSEYLEGNRDGRAVLCAGKEWHRFPSSFFLPNDQWRLEFIQSEFKVRKCTHHFLMKLIALFLQGILPKPFPSLPIPNASRVVPTDMNDMNREEPSRYVDVSSCDFLIDFDNGETAAMEPKYAADTDRWELAFSSRFLIASQSHRLFRAFFIPFVSESHCVYGSYQLLRAKRQASNKTVPKRKNSKPTNTGDQQETS